ncbi:hypothetical protein F4680DRAFT_192656 [Xylaria scruposa]|nr:hypothetical protein F4680DRAFT_192656 [Xylaria scruposa]
MAQQMPTLDHPLRGGSRGLKLLRRSLKNEAIFRHLEHLTISKDNTADENLRRSASFAYLGSKLAFCHEASLKSKSNQATLPMRTENKIQVTSGEKTHLLCTYEGCKRAIPGNGFSRWDNRQAHLRRVHNDMDIELSKSDDANQLDSSSVFSESFIPENHLNGKPIQIDLDKVDRARLTNLGRPPMPPQSTKLGSSRTGRLSSISSIASTPRPLTPKSQSDWRIQKRTRSSKLSSNMKPIDRWRPRISSQPIPRSLQTSPTGQPGSLFRDRSSIDSGIPSADAG